MGSTVNYATSVYFLLPIRPRDQRLQCATYPIWQKPTKHKCLFSILNGNKLVVAWAFPQDIGTQFVHLYTYPLCYKNHVHNQQCCPPRTVSVLSCSLLEIMYEVWYHTRGTWFASCKVLLYATQLGVSDKGVTPSFFTELAYAVLATRSDTQLP